MYILFLRNISFKWCTSQWIDGLKQKKTQVAKHSSLQLFCSVWCYVLLILRIPDQLLFGSGYIFVKYIIHVNYEYINTVPKKRKFSDCFISFVVLFLKIKFYFWFRRAFTISTGVYAYVYGIFLEFRRGFI